MHMHYYIQLWLQECSSSYGITRYYIIAMDHVYAQSAELVHKEVKKPRPGQLCSVMSQSRYGAYRKTYQLVSLKRSHRYLFCSPRVHQEAKKAAVISKCRHIFRTKHFQRNPHNTYVEISTESLMAPNFQRINEVCSSQLGIRATDTQTDRQNEYRNHRTCALRVNKILQITYH